MAIIMQSRGLTFAEIMVVVAIIAVLAVIAIPNVLRARMNANEANAKTILSIISSSIESYAAANSGNYPDNFTVDLYEASPKYVNEDYLLAGNNPRNGYNFACGTLNATTYSCSAIPQDCGSSGTRTFTVTAGGVLTSAACTP